MTEEVMVALVVGGSASLVALINQIPISKYSKKVDQILKVVKGLRDFVEEEETVENVRKRFRQIQTYYVAKIEKEKDKLSAISKSEAFITLVCDYAMTLDYSDVNSFTQFKEHLLSASAASKQRMIGQVGAKKVKIYYSSAGKKMLRYADIVQKIFFANENSKRSKVISASIDFMQSFMDDFVCVVNYERINDEAGLCMQRHMDHRSAHETVSETDSIIKKK